MKMNSLTKLMIPVLAIGIGFASCDKGSTTTVPTTTVDTPKQTTATPTPVTPNVGSGIWGAMVALKMKYSYTNPQLPTPVVTTSELGVATFYDNNNGSGAIVDAGKVSVNSNELKKETNNSYNITATTGLTPSTLDLGSSVKWSVAGGSGIPAINYTHSGAFPDYSGTVATEIDKSKDLVVDLGSKITGADSVYVVVVTSSKTIIKAFGGNPAPAKATIDAAELGSLPTVSDNTAYLEIVPFTYKVVAQGGKDFAFIKETAVLSSVNIK